MRAVRIMPARYGWPVTRFKLQRLLTQIINELMDNQF